MNNKSLTGLAKEFDAEGAEDFTFKPHVFPRYPSPVSVSERDKLKIKKMNYGLIPSFEKNEKPKMVFHNARVETIHEKPSFKYAFLHQHCVVPLTSFMAYITLDPPVDGKKNWIAEFKELNHETLTVAGIWNRWVSPTGEMTDTYSIITREPSEFILKVGHDRSPFFIQKDGIQEWLSSGSKDWFKVLGEIKSEPLLKT